MTLVPIRELFELHRQDVTARLDRIDRKLDRIDENLDGHTHREKVSWSAAVPLALALLALLLGLS